ncbi:MAG: DUF2203 domain-containing protein [Chloroflexi bacterium]|nr:DUF2203 domain-containing protein [Chloroflexota bacterium]
MQPRHFTPEQVNRLIPRLEELLAELRDARRELIAQERQFGRVMGQKAEGNGFHIEQENQAASLKSETDDSISRFRGLVQAVSDLGAEVKDPETGLVDFLGLLEGREVYLCWRLGEPECAWWHDLDTGFGGRQPLP